jgi:hypothetical protein
MLQSMDVMNVRPQHTNPHDYLRMPSYRHRHRHHPTHMHPYYQPIIIIHICILFLDRRIQTTIEQHREQLLIYILDQQCQFNH